MHREKGVAIHKDDSSFLAVAAVLFVVSAAWTIYWCGSMSQSMAMPGDWAMAMAWMKMQGQSSLAAAASFLAMWIVMMVAMMLPSLSSMLMTYRCALRGMGAARVGQFTILAGAGYFLVWAALGAIAYPIGLLVTTLEMRSQTLAQSVPIATGGVVLLAGCLQLTEWKWRHLMKCCGSPTGGTSRTDACRHGVFLGVNCGLCCLSFTLVLLVIGVMDVRAMAILASAITIERLAPKREQVVRALGVLIIAAGAFLIARAVANLA